MAQQNLNLGSIANDGTGDDLRSAMQKVEANFTELYNASSIGHQIVFDGNELKTNVSNANLKLTANGTGVIELEGIQISGNNISATRTNDDLVLSPAGTGKVKISGLSFPNSDGTNDQFLTTDGAGTLSFASLPGLKVADDSSTTATIGRGDTLRIAGGTNVTTSISGEILTINASLASGGQFDNVLVSGDSVTNTATNQHLNLTTTGTGNVRIQGGVGFDYNTTTGSSSAAVTIDQFTMATYRSASYTVQITDATNLHYQVSQLNVIHDGSNVYYSEHGVVYSDRQLATLSADVDSGSVRIRAVPIGSVDAVYKTFRSAIIV